jgi:hypothetical protein
MEQVFLQNSENIRELIQLMKLHEETILHREPMNLDSTEPIQTPSYVECEYSSLSPYSKCIPSFEPKDKMILVRACGHAFRKEPFLNWIKTHKTCMECPTLLV